MKCCPGCFAHTTSVGFLEVSPVTWKYEDHWQDEDFGAGVAVDGAVHWRYTAQFSLSTVTRTNLLNQSDFR